MVFFIMLEELLVSEYACHWSFGFLDLRTQSRFFLVDFILFILGRRRKGRDCHEYECGQQDEVAGDMHGKLRDREVGFYSTNKRRKTPSTFVKVDAEIIPQELCPRRSRLMVRNWSQSRTLG